MRWISASSGLRRSCPLLPSSTTGLPFSSSRARGSMPATAGMSSARAMIATCEVAPPPTVQKPNTRSGSRLAVSEGLRSSAMRMLSAGISGSSCVWPVTMLNTRRPTSRRSAARAAINSFFSCPRRSAWVVKAFRQAKAALLPLAMQLSAISTRSGSSSNSWWAAKIAALAGSDWA